MMTPLGRGLDDQFLDSLLGETLSTGAAPYRKVEETPARDAEFRSRHSKVA